MKWVRFAVLVCATAVLQADMVDVIAVSRLNIKPDLLLILMVFFAVFADATNALIASFVIGFAADIIALGFPMGTQTISFTIVGAAVTYLNSVLAVRQMFYQGIIIVISGFLVGVLSQFLAFVTNQPTVSDVYAVIFGTSLYSGILGPFLFLPCAWLMRIKTHRFSRQ